MEERKSKSSVDATRVAVEYPSGTPTSFGPEGYGSSSPPADDSGSTFVVKPPDDEEAEDRDIADWQKEMEKNRLRS